MSFLQSKKNRKTKGGEFTPSPQTVFATRGFHFLQTRIKHLSNMFNFRIPSRRRHKTTKTVLVRGFTLVELLVAMAVFLVVMTMSLGAVLSILDAGRKAKSLKDTMTNLNFSQEVMTRDIKFGKNYYCGEDLTNPHTATQSCSSTPGSSFTFTSSDGVDIVYKLIGTQITKSVNRGPYIAVTSPAVTITDLKYYVFGTAPISTPDYNQPRVLAIIRGYAGAKPTSQSSFVLQTTISQRVLDSDISLLPTPPPSSVPVVSIVANPTSGTVNVVNPELTWGATNSPTSCSASGDWSGSKSTSGNDVSQGVLSVVKTYIYTLVCTNSIGDSAPASATVAVSSASSGYTYVKWEITKKFSSASDGCTGGTGSCIQISEFRLYSDGSIVPWPGGTAASGGSTPPSENAPKLIDGLTSTKFLDWGFAVGDAQNGLSTVIFNAGVGNAVDFNGYQWATGNDTQTFPARNPVSWTVSGSNDGSSWTLLDSQTDASVPGTNTTYTAVYNFGAPPPPSLPNPATNPSPANAATGVAITATPSWTAGTGATSHDVYFGTNPTPGAGEFKGNQGGTTYNPGTLLNSTTYYWRIDEKNAQGTTPGTVWSFTTLAGAPTFAAAGGTITESGGYKYHTFTGSGTFQVTSGSGNVEVLVVGGGAGGGTGGTASRGGGGAGGIVYNSSYAVSVNSYTVTVGAGSAGASSLSIKSDNGGNSVFDTITALGGGGAGPHNTAGTAGGSGGGGSGWSAQAGGSGLQPGSPSGGFGNNGGAAMSGVSGQGASGGGGGAGAVGGTGVSGQGGVGGIGRQYSQFSTVGGSPAGWFGGGGGGGAVSGTIGGSGGQGGGGAGVSSGVGGAGIANTGGGGGGSVSTGGAGGSGIVIVRYPTP